MPKNDSKQSAHGKRTNQPLERSVDPHLEDRLRGFVHQWRETSHLTPGDKRARDLVDVFEAIKTAYVDAEYQDLTPAENAEGRAKNASFLEKLLANSRYYLQERGFGRRGRARDADYLEHCARIFITETLDNEERARMFFQILRASPSVCSETRVPHRDAPYDADQRAQDMKAVSLVFKKHTSKTRVDTEKLVKEALRVLEHDPKKNDNFFAHRNQKKRSKS